jgi:hypothetical protein
MELEISPSVPCLIYYIGRCTVNFYVLQYICLSHFSSFVLNKWIYQIFSSEYVDIPTTYFHTHFASVLKISSYIFCRYVYDLPSRTFFLDRLTAHIHVHVVDICVNHPHTLFVDVFWMHLRIFYSATTPREPELPHCRGSMITRTHTTLGTVPLEEESARRKGLNLTTNNTHNRQTSMFLTEFEVAIPTRPQTRALDRAATGIGISKYLFIFIISRP